MNLLNVIQSMKILLDDNFKNIRWFIASELFKEMVECVNHLHKFTPTIIHRDIKPHNILVTQNSARFLKLCDFGLSKHLDHRSLTRDQGTLRYMAPEIKNINGNYNEKADIYSMAIVATELFACDYSDNTKKMESSRDL